MYAWIVYNTAVEQYYFVTDVHPLTDEEVKGKINFALYSSHEVADDIYEVQRCKEIPNGVFPISIISETSNRLEA